MSNVIGVPPSLSTATDIPMGKCFGDRNRSPRTLPLRSRERAFRKDIEWNRSLGA